MKTVLSYLATAMLLAIGFAGYEGWKWYSASKAIPQQRSPETEKLVHRMLNDAGWRPGKNDLSCIVNQQMNLIVWEDGRIQVWKDDTKAAGGFLKAFAKDKNYIAEAYPKAIEAMEQRMLTKFFEKDKLPMANRSGYVSHDVDASKKDKAAVKKLLADVKVDAPEVLAVPLPEPAKPKDEAPKPEVLTVMPKEIQQIEVLPPPRAEELPPMPKADE